MIRIMPCSNQGLFEAAAQHGRKIAFANEGGDGLAGLKLMDAVSQATDTLVEVVDLLIALIEATLQVENSNDSGEVYALVGKLVNELEALDVSLGVHTSVSARALRGNQALLLVGAQGLGMNASQLSCNANHVQGSVSIAYSHVLTSFVVAAKKSSMAFLCSSFILTGTSTRILMRKLPVRPFAVTSGAPLPRTVRTVPL